MEPKDKTPDDMGVNSKEESADLPVFAERSKRPNTCKPNGTHNVLTHTILKIRIVRSASSQKLFELRAGIAWKQEESATIIH